MMKTKLEQSPILQTFFRQNSHQFHWQGHVWFPRVGPSSQKSSRASRATGDFWTSNVKQPEGRWFSEHFTCKSLVFLRYLHQGNKKSDAEVVLPQTPFGVLVDVKNTCYHPTVVWILLIKYFLHEREELLFFLQVIFFIGKLCFNFMIFFLVEKSQIRGF